MKQVEPKQLLHHRRTRTRERATGQLEDCPERVEEIKCESKTSFLPCTTYVVPNLSVKCVSYAKGHFGTTSRRNLPRKHLALVERVSDVNAVLSW